jgi:ATP-dependent Clp protease ATP-binding subunit ClpC
MLTDSHGRKVSFKNAIVIMTTNVGAELITNLTPVGFRQSLPDLKDPDVLQKEHEGMEEKIMKELKKAFRPEFLNRVDEFIIFRSLTREDIRSIVSLFIKRVRERVEAKGLHLEVDDTTIEHIVHEGYDPTNGARPVRRLVQRYIEDPLSEKLLLCRYKDGETFHVRYIDGEIEIEGSVCDLGKGDPAEQVEQIERDIEQDKDELKI